jgi:hypothetical protein
LLIETALDYARKIGSAKTLEQAQELARVAVDQLEQVKAKIDRRRQSVREGVAQ